jgi:hypothetical protein
LIFPRIEEFKKTFEIMFSKLKKSSIDFSKDKELKKVKYKNNNEIQDFLLIPEKDNFSIRASNFETNTI